MDVSHGSTTTTQKSRSTRGMQTPTEVRTQLASALGTTGLPYWRALSDFLQGNTSRIEFEELVRQWVNTPDLVALHNSLLVAILISSSAQNAPKNNTPVTPGPPRKKRRLLPHQDPPPKLNRWIVGIGKTERNRIRIAAHKRNANPSLDNEITRERPIRTVMEGKYRPGAHVPLPLSSITRSLPTTQHLTDRMVLIAAQHSMTASKSAASLLSAAVEAYLKQITMHALAATSSSHPFSSIMPSERTSRPPISLLSFNTLFTLAPFEAPVISASVMNLAVAGANHDEEDEDDEALPNAHWETRDPATRQTLKLLLSSSGLRAVAKSKFKP